MRRKRMAAGRCGISADELKKGENSETNTENNLFLHAPGGAQEIAPPGAIIVEESSGAY